MNVLGLSEQYGYGRVRGRYVQSYDGEVEIIVKWARTGEEVSRQRYHNIIKIFSKEILSHRLPYSKVWDPNAALGAGAWVAHSLDLDEWAPKYICFGASFDVNGQSLNTEDTRFYSYDPVTEQYVPNTVDVGATYDGGLINPVPIAEPYRPLKRIERIYFEPSYAPAGVPLLQPDVRAMNNVVVFETTLEKDEYNGFGHSAGDFFTLTEVALVAAAEVGSVGGSCECDPHSIFMTGMGNVGIPCTTSGTATITLQDIDVTGELGNVTEPYLDIIKEGDQVKIVSSSSPSSGDAVDILGQVSPYYLVLSKVPGGRDIVLDRTPVDSNNTPLTGVVGVWRDGFRVFSHRILKSPTKKSEDYQVTVRWRILMA